MKRIGLLIGFLAVMVFLLPLAAQDAKTDAKKDAAKTDKKDDDKKDPEKKDAKKEPEKKKEKLVYGARFYTKIVNMKGETNREYTIEVQERDPKKVYDVNVWSTTRQQQLAQQYVNALKQKDGGAALRNWMRDSAAYQVEMGKKDVFTAKNVEVRAHETAKVRSMVPPIEFDDKGFQKKWTKKELAEHRDKTGLPGFPADFDAIKSGQQVEIYMAKVTPPKKTDTKKKKGPDDDDPVMKDRPLEFVLMVIMADGKQ